MKLITTRYNPCAPSQLNAFGQLTRELDQWFGATSGQGTTYPAPLDIVEDSEAYVFQVDLPGVDKKDVVLTLQEGVLTISGERKAPAEPKDDEYARYERGYGRFQRRVELPKPVRVDAVTAAYKDGVLTVTVPKAAEAKPRQIDISTN